MTLKAKFSSFFKSFRGEEARVYINTIPLSNSEILMERIEKRGDKDELVPLDYLMHVEKPAPPASPEEARKR
jgi:hypothetical protein